MFGLRTFSLTVGPLISCSAWARLPSLSRSHSHASSRAGWPNVLRNGWFTSPSGNWTARVPAGRPANFSGTPVTSHKASSSCSAVKSFVVAWEKYRASSLFVSFGTAESWYVRDRMTVRTKCRRSYPLRSKSAARAASSSSFDAGLESRKSSTGSTIPLPVRWNQTRLATDLAKNGLSPAVSHFANTSRRSTPGGITGTAPPMKRGGIALPVRGWITSPARSR